MNPTFKAIARNLTLALAAVFLQSEYQGLAQGEPVSGLAAIQKAAPAAEAESAPSAVESSPAMVEEPDGPTPPEAKSPEITVRESRSSSELVSFGKDIELKSNETAQVVVVIGGSARIQGKVNEAVVVIGGSIEMSGEAETAVAIFGNVNLLGQAKVNEAVAILGNVRVSDRAETHEAVAVGGRVDVTNDGRVTGEKVSLGLPGIAAPEWVQAWFKECVMKLRPLAPQVGWVWALAGIVFLLYLLVALVFQAPVKACVDEIVNRPASTFLVGLLTKMLLPLLLLVLVGTGIGVFVVPFVVVAVLVMGIFGKVAILQAMGVGLGRSFGSAAIQRPLPAFLIGAVILALLYMVPVLGLIVWVVSGVWGLGAAVMAAAGRIRRETPRRQPATAPARWPNTPVATFATADVGSMPTGGFQPAESTVPRDPTSPAVDPLSPAAPPAADALTYPFAGFWERMGAAFLDVILVSLAGSLVGGPPLAFLVALAYFSGMWAWRGTTIGGIVLGLKVVRLDGQPLTFAAALVRGLAAAFSIVVLFLGFLWIAWDGEKQGWHDKIAGTVVLKMPRGAPLVCV